MYSKEALKNKITMRPEFWNNGKQHLGNKLTFKNIEQLHKFLRQYRVMLCNECCD